MITPGRMSPRKQSLRTAAIWLFILHLIPGILVGLAIFFPIRNQYIGIALVTSVIVAVIAALVLFALLIEVWPRTESSRRKREHALVAMLLLGTVGALWAIFQFTKPETCEHTEAKGNRS